MTKPHDGIDSIVTSLASPQGIRASHGPLVYWCNAGLGKSPNQDVLYLNTDRNIFACIDGIGGEGGGELAAKILAQACQEKTRSQNLSPEVVESIQHLAHRDMDLARVGGACYAIFQIKDDELRVYHAGDVKLVVIDKNNLSVNETKDQGNWRGVSNAVMGSKPGYVTENIFPLEVGYKILLASDGLWYNEPAELAGIDFFGDTVQVEDIVATTEYVSRLCGLTKKWQETPSGKRDNISLILTEIEEL